MVSNPEFLKEGAAIADFMRPDRVVVGTDNPRTAELLRALYEPFTRSRENIIVMDVRSAELTKYAANAMLATKISFMNELANLAERFGADIEKVRVGIGSDPRIGYTSSTRAWLRRFLLPEGRAGAGAQRARARVRRRAARRWSRRSTSAEAGAVREDQQHFGGNSRGQDFRVWGLAFKPNTDDMREAPSRVLIEALWKAGANVRAFDPAAMDEARPHLRRARLISCCADERRDGARRRRRAGDRHRVAGIPQSGLRRDQRSAASRSSSTAATSTTRPS